MGCSNSSSAGEGEDRAHSEQNELHSGGCRDSKDTTDDTSSQDDKHRNYGGVYVGLPADTSMYSSKEAQVAASSQSYAQNTQPGSSLPENIC